jgi:hypothetical protein
MVVHTVILINGGIHRRIMGFRQAPGKRKTLCENNNQKRGAGVAGVIRIPD